ncbi:hypothetical protein FACS1894217_13970 [Clostridia bacterium]|nr:hypothetical protein FACS1894217_13970 [Clostridia bacterium]
MVNIMREKFDITNNLIALLLSLLILSSCGFGGDTASDNAIEGKDVTFPFGQVLDPATKDLPIRFKTPGEIYKQASTQSIASLITKTYSETELLKSWHFGGYDDVVTQLWFLAKNYSVECFRLFSGISLPYAVFELEEGGYLFAFFHKGNSCDYAFVVKKPLTRKDFKSIKKGMTARDVEAVDPGFKTYNEYAYLEYLIHLNTLHMVDDGFIRITYTSDWESTAETPIPDLEALIVDKVEYLKNGTINPFDTSRFSLRELESRKPFAYTVLEGDYPKG